MKVQFKKNNAFNSTTMASSHSNSEQKNPTETEKNMYLILLSHKFT